MPRKIPDGSPEQALDIQTCPLEDLMSWETTEEALDLVRSTRAALGGEDKFLGSLAVDFLELEPRFESIRHNLQSIRTGGNKPNAPKKKGRSGNPRVRDAAEQQAKKAPEEISESRVVFRAEEVTRLCRLGTRTYEYGLALGQAMLGNAGPLGDLEPWGDDVLPPAEDLSDDQQLVMGRFDEYMAAAEALGPGELVELHPLQRMLVMREAWGAISARIAITEEYLAGFYMSRLRSVLDRVGVQRAFSQPLPNDTEGRQKRQGYLLHWRGQIHHIPTLSREPADISRRNDLVRTIDRTVPEIFRKRVKAGPTDFRLQDTQRELLRVDARYDTIASTWEVADQQFLDLYIPHREQTHKAAEPLVEYLRTVPGQLQAAAAPWTALEEGDSRSEETEEAARFLARLCPDMGRQNALFVISLTTHLRDGALSADEERVKDAALNFLGAVKYERELLQDYDDTVIAIKAHGVEVPDGVERSTPLLSVVGLTLDSWDDVCDVMRYRTGGKEVRIAFETVQAWLKKAKKLAEKSRTTTDEQST